MNKKGINRINGMFMTLVKTYKLNDLMLLVALLHEYITYAQAKRLNGTLTIADQDGQPK